MARIMQPTGHDDPFQWTLGDRLAKARRVAGITVEEMAERLFVSRNTIGNYEHDRTVPSKAKVRAWAEMTGAALDWLRGENSTNSGDYPWDSASEDDDTPRLRPVVGTIAADQPPIPGGDFDGYGYGPGSKN